MLYAIFFLVGYWSCFFVNKWLLKKAKKEAIDLIDEGRKELAKGLDILRRQKAELDDYRNRSFGTEY